MRQRARRLGCCSRSSALVLEQLVAHCFHCSFLTTNRTNQTNIEVVGSKFVSFALFVVRLLWFCRQRCLLLDRNRKSRFEDAICLYECFVVDRRFVECGQWPRRLDWIFSSLVIYSSASWPLSLFIAPFGPRIA